jgi:23S rRNA pseudouridine1911/1915/1917 synthase
LQAWGEGRLTFVVPLDQRRERLDKVLARLVPDVSRATLQRWIEEGRVQLDGHACRSRDVVRGGARIEVQPGAPPASHAIPDATVEFAVVYEDPHLIVVDKPAGLVVHPARGHVTGTLVNGLLGRGDFDRDVADPLDPEGALRPGIVHRIDKDTSGLLVVARDDRTREGLKTQLSEHSVERLYRALTVGVPREGRISTLHGRDPKSRLKFTARVREGRTAVTHVSVVERFGGARAALVECRLETGRTHQIRVHLTENTRTPLIAEALYAPPARDPDIQRIAEGLGRQALHAAVLGFEHPVSGERLRFESPLPPDMERALGELRALPTSSR